MTLSFVLDGAGWATATVTVDSRFREMTVSYLSDSLAEMTQAAVCLLEGADSVRFSFDDEPGEHGCIVTRIRESEAQVLVLWFEELWSDLPDERGLEVFICTCSVSRFCGEVLACLQRLLDKHGLDGYKERWVSHDFPSEKFERLRRLVYERSREKAPA
jgi:hypothetical protein